MPAHLRNLDLTLSDFRHCWKPLCSRLFQCSYRARLCDSLNLLTERFEMPVYYYYYYSVQQRLPGDWCHIYYDKLLNYTYRTAHELDCVVIGCCSVLNHAHNDMATSWSRYHIQLSIRSMTEATAKCIRENGGHFQHQLWTLGLLSLSGLTAASLCSPILWVILFSMISQSE